jgi:hypothetical protein
MEIAIVEANRSEHRRRLETDDLVTSSRQTSLQGSNLQVAAAELARGRRRWWMMRAETHSERRDASGPICSLSTTAGMLARLPIGSVAQKVHLGQAQGFAIPSQDPRDWTQVWTQTPR